MVSLKGKNHSFPNKETHMTSIVDPSVHIQTSTELAPCPPPWFVEVVLLAAHLKKQGILAKLCERVQFARRRFGRYDVVDFLIVLFGYAISGERTMEEFYKRLQPVAVAFMAGAGTRPVAFSFGTLAFFSSADGGTR
jgi:hypothetical protein